GQNVKSRSGAEIGVWSVARQIEALDNAAFAIVEHRVAVERPVDPVRSARAVAAGDGERLDQRPGAGVVLIDECPRSANERTAGEGSDAHVHKRFDTGARRRSEERTADQRPAVVELRNRSRTEIGDVEVAGRIET